MASFTIHLRRCLIATMKYLPRRTLSREGFIRAHSSGDPVHDNRKAWWLPELGQPEHEQMVLRRKQEGLLGEAGAGLCPRDPLPPARPQLIKILPPLSASTGESFQRHELMEGI